MKKIFLVILALSIALSGCSVNFYKKSPADEARISELSGQVRSLSEMREKERMEFEEMKRELDKKLKGAAGVEVEERGLVITLADNILFDSGRADLKKEAYPILDNISAVIKSKAADKNIGIEGHTDNVPIKYSGWKSNRELSTARANNVYHYLVDSGSLNPAKLTTMGYGEFRPVASNNTEEGMGRNRRVEIVILPQFARKAQKAAKELKTKIK